MPSDNPLVPIPRANLPAPTQHPPWPVSARIQVLQACNPGKPLVESDSRRADLKALRHGGSIEPLCERLMMPLEEGEYHHLLLCGHGGSGKSTELLTLKSWAESQGFLAARVEVNSRYGMIELDYSDLFLLAAVLIEKAMQDCGYPLPQEKLGRIIRWFSEIIHEDTDERKSEIGVEVGMQLGGSLPFSLGSLFTKLTASFKGTTAHSIKTRDTLRRYPGTLIDYTRDLLETANATLTAIGKPRGMLLIFDNLDRYDPANIDAILVRGSQQMRQLACHALFTFPIALAYKPITGKVSEEYGLQITLPMLALRHHAAPWADTVADSDFDPASIALLRSALAKRIVIEDVFANPEDADLLIKMSGGAIRDLMKLVSSAATFAEGGETQISSEAAQKAVENLRSVYMRFLTTTPYDYRCLAAIAKRESVAMHKDNYSEAINRLLFNGCLLEYTENGKPWLDVHPVLIETEEFRNACRANDKTEA